MAKIIHLTTVVGFEVIIGKLKKWKKIYSKKNFKLVTSFKFFPYFKDLSMK